MEKTKAKKREWVKTFVIIFLVVMLILTFFSNTIMNRSLPEVAAQYTQSGSINAKIRGTGQVSANETYDVTLNQTRKIRSVMVKVGDQVSTGDTLFVLEPNDSEELKQAQESLAQMELDYQKKLITLSNDNSTENREVKKLRNAYEEALTIFRLYSNADPSQIAIASKEAEAYLKILQRESQDIDNALAEINAELTDAQAEVTDWSQKVSELKTVQGKLDDNQNKLDDINRDIERDWYIHEKAYRALEDYADGDQTKMAAYAKDMDRLLADFVDWNITEAEWKDLSDAYTVMTADWTAQRELQDEREALMADVDYDTLKDAEKYLSRAERRVESLEYDVESLESNATDAKHAVVEQQAVVDNYSAAKNAADALQSAKTALEDKVFTQNLGSTENLDLQNDKVKIDEQKKLVEELTANADGQEVKAEISGTIGSINVTAGNTAGAETPIATITVADRGYTLKIPVTVEQSRQVRIGDTANIVNYWYGDLSATLENIANDPENPGKGKLLIFRITGSDVEPGSNMTLSIGQKSANYDCLIPNSAIRTDANGTFVLVVVAKNTPLGNRYVATRADVTVLASDDTSSAVSGIANGDFVITTSSKPLEAGMQVRLVDNT